jgi:hypothetical protein
VHFGSRDYDPRTGRWLQRDPILFDGGQANLYEYTFDDPLDYVDPTGEVGYGPGHNNVPGPKDPEFLEKASRVIKPNLKKPIDWGHRVKLMNLFENAKKTSADVCRQAMRMLKPVLEKTYRLKPGKEPIITPYDGPLPFLPIIVITPEMRRLLEPGYQRGDVPLA